MAWRIPRGGGGGSAGAWMHVSQPLRACVRLATAGARVSDTGGKALQGNAALMTSHRMPRHGLLRLLSIHAPAFLFHMGEEKEERKKHVEV